VALKAATAAGAKAVRKELMTVNQTGNSIAHGVTACTDSGVALENVDIASEATPGWTFLKNLNTSGTDYVTFGPHQTDNHAITLLPGESCLFRANIDLYGKASSGATIFIEWLTVEV
jgi:hypothetical protein